MSILYNNKILQVNLTMSNLLISNTWHMLNCLSTPAHFPYIVLYVKLVIDILGYQKISAISGWFFIPENKLCVYVK